MSPILIIFLLVLVGAAMLFAELFLPTHGLLGVMGAITILSAVGYAFVQNQWAGTLMLLVLACLTPFAWAWMVKWWPRSPLGRRMVLQPIEPVMRDIPVQIGETGQTLSALRPTGICDFGGKRLEAKSELGIIEPGMPIKVVAIDAERITVRSI